MPNPVSHFEVLGKDGRALERFYGQAFGWETQDVMDGAYYMVNPGSGVQGGIGAVPEGSDGHVTFYVEVEDLSATLEKIGELGGRTLQEPMEIPNGPTIAMFADPEGHPIGLVRRM